MLLFYPRGDAYWIHCFYPGAKTLATAASGKSCTSQAVEPFTEPKVRGPVVLLGLPQTQVVWVHQRLARAGRQRRELRRLPRRHQQAPSVRECRKLDLKRDTTWLGEEVWPLARGKTPVLDLRRRAPFAAWPWAHDATSRRSRLIHPPSYRQMFETLASPRILPADYLGTILRLSEAS